MTSDDRERSQSGDRAGWVLLSVAAMVAVVLGCRGIGDPWEEGFRGLNGGGYTGTFVRHHLALGLGVTHGSSISVVEPFEPPVLQHYLSHPPTFTLLVLLPCSLLGVSEAVIRATALVLFLPALLAIFLIARRFVGPRGAGATALLFAASPMAAYFGPMAIPDGSVLMASTWVVWAFLRWADEPARGSAAALAATWILACLLDWTGFFAGAVLLALVPLAGSPRRAFRAVFLLGALAAVPVALVFAHLASASGGLAPALDAVRGVSGNAAGTAVPLTALVVATASHLWSWVGWPTLSLAVLGLILGLLQGRAGRRAVACAAALTLPGLLNTALFRNHAVIHDFWMIHSMPGIALLAAIPVAWSLGALRRAPGGVVARRRAAACLACAGAIALSGTVAYGSIATMKAVDRNRTTLYRDLGKLLNRRFGAHDVIASTFNVKPTSYYTDACLVGPIYGPPQVRTALATYAPILGAGHCIGFVLPASAADTPLGRYLSMIARPERLGFLLAYRVERRQARSR